MYKFYTGETKKVMIQLNHYEVKLRSSELNDLIDHKSNHKCNYMGMQPRALIIFMLVRAWTSVVQFV